MARKKKTAPKSLRESLGFDAPQSRNEAILQNILGADMVAQSRNEEILIDKIKGEEYDKEPQSRIEALPLQWATPASTEEEDNA